MLISYALGQASIVLRVKILDSSVSTGAGKTGLSSASTGLIISTIADNEATATAYTVAAGNVEAITTLGTYQAPTASKCRFKEVDATNHPGVYEVHLADARYAVTSAKSLLVSISGATDAAECDAVIPLTQLNPYDGVRAGLTALPNAAANAAGGLPISTDGGFDVDATVQTDDLPDNFGLMQVSETGVVTASASGSVIITPLSVTVSAGAVSDQGLTVYQYTAPAFVFTLTLDDDDETPVSVAGDDLRFIVYDITSGASLWELTTGSGAITIGGDDNNQVAVTIDDPNTETPGTYRYALRNMTDDLVHAAGSLEVVAVPDGGA